MDTAAASRLSPAVLTPQALHLEQERQARLLVAIRAGHGPLPAGWTGHRVGLLAHQRHARATARRALAGAYPVLARWLGEAAFDTLAWWHWRRAPPRRGDLGTWGAALPAALAAGQALASDARAELARLEWAVHVAARAPDPVSGLPQNLDALQTTSPEALWLLPQPGLSVLPCGPQVLARWSAAQPMLPPAQGAQAAGGRGDPLAPCGWALVRRVGWQVAVRALPADQARFTRRLLAGDSLGQALTRAAPGDFQDWLRAALAEGWWRAVSTAALRSRHDKEDEP